MTSDPSSYSSDNSELQCKVKLKVRKKGQSLDFRKCIICQKPGDLIIAKDASKETFLNATKIRGNAGLRVAEANVHIDLLYKNINDIKSRVVSWHKKCYSTYTSKRNIEGYLSKLNKDSISKIANQNETDAGPSHLLRKEVFDPNLCIFCQKRLKDRKLSQVMTQNVEEKIKAIAKKDSKLLAKIGKNDLIAYEIKYHSTCFTVAWRKSRQCSSTTLRKETINEVSLQKLFYEMEKGFSKGKGYTTTSIYNRYLEINKDNDASNRLLMQRITSHFKERIDIVSSNKCNEPRTIVPKITKAETIHSYISETENDSEYLDSMFTGPSETSILHKICNEIKIEMANIPSYKKVLSLDNSEYRSYVPEKLYFLISLLLCDREPDSQKETIILNICQDIIYAFSEGKNYTPKHIGLGMLIHQETKSKKIIDILHDCGHSISYKEVLRLRNTIAQKEITLFLQNDKVVIPRQLTSGRFIQFAADNIDILEETLDKSPTFHGTQLAVFQRGPLCADTSNEDFELLPYKTKLLIPEDFHFLSKANFTKTARATPPLPNKQQILEKTQNQNVIKNQNTAWILCRIQNCNTGEKPVVPQWSGFHRLLYQNSSQVTTYGYLPLIPYVASEYDTVWTVMQRCSAISKKMDNIYTVITFDQAIYYKAKELQWLKPEETSHFIIRLGGFHTMMNFLKVIGQHMTNSGLSDVWLESGLYGASTVEGILNGKKWNKAIRAHKLTYESLMRILMPLFEKWLIECRSDAVHSLNFLTLLAGSIAEGIKKNSESLSCQFEKMSEKVTDITQLFSEFIQCQSPTFQFWYSYLELVEVLLEFMFGERNGKWERHLNAFQNMLPWFFAYDHTNYSRWGAIYLVDMYNLPEYAPEVYKEFMEGNFVIKRLEGNFIQLSVDQALEHINKNSKDAGGIVGLTKNSTRLDEWFLSFNQIGVMVNNFAWSINRSSSSVSQNIEIGEKRIKVDEESVIKLTEQFNRFQVFTKNEAYLQSICTNEVASDVIQKSLLSAKQNGIKILETFVEKIGTKDFYKPLKKNNVQTLKHNKVKERVTDTKTIWQQGQEYLQKILAAKEMGRNINYGEIFRYELTPYPMAFAPNGVLNTPSNKSALGNIIETYTTSYKELPELPAPFEACYIFDGMSLVQGLGKPALAKTFADYATTFKNIIFKNPYKATRIDLVMDHYKEQSIKNCTREKRGSVSGINRLIDNVNSYLPQQWNQFIHSTSNKKELTHFLCNEMHAASQNYRVKFVTSGGFKNIFEYKSNYILQNDLLSANHEEADTRILLHVLSAKREGYKRCIIDCRDTDVLVLLCYFKNQLTEEVWMKVGVKDAVRFIAVHELKMDEVLLRNLPAFHAISGCDTTSQLVGFGKKVCWNTFKKHPNLLKNVGVQEEFDDSLFLNMEKFIIKLYTSNEDITCINNLRGILATSKTINKLPPTKDSLRQHCLRVHYQTKLWVNSMNPKPDLPNILENGWEIVEKELRPKLMSQSPTPKNVSVLTVCSCKKGCIARSCSCKKNGLSCIGSCKCMAQSSSCSNCHNPALVNNGDDSSGSHSDSE